MIFFLPPFIQAPTTITYTHVAENCVDAINDLAKATGLKLRAAPAMKREILLISVHNASVTEVMAKIATTCDGVWQNDNGVGTLRRSFDYPTDPAAIPTFSAVAEWQGAKQFSNEMGSKAKIRDSSSARLFALSLAAKYEDALRANPQLGSLNAGNVMLNSMEEFPLTHLAYKLFSAMPANLLATIPSNQSRTFSNEPTGYELKLPFDPLPIVETALQQQRWLSNDMPEKDKVDIGPFDHSHASFLWAPVKGKIAKVDLIIGHTNAEAPVRVLLEDATGKPIRDIAVNTWLYGATSGLSPVKFTIPSGFSVTPGPEAIALTNTLLPDEGGSGQQIPLSSEAIDLLSHPFDHEPLGRYPSRVFIALGKAMDLNVVADLPDAFLNLGRYSKTLRTELSFMLSSDDWNMYGIVNSSKGWLTISGGQLRGPLAYRDDRLELQHMLTSSSDHVLSIEDIIAYLKRSPDTETQGDKPMGEMLANALTPLNASLTQNAPSWAWEIMQYGLPRLNTDGSWTIKVSDLSEKLRQVISLATIFSLQDAYQEFGFYGSPLSKPLAETLNGDWQKGVSVTMQISSGIAAMHTPRVLQTGIPHFFPPEMLAQLDGEVKIHGSSSYSSLEDNKKFIPVTFRQLVFNLSVRFQGADGQIENVDVAEVHPTGPPVTFKHLPESLLAAIHEAAKHAYIAISPQNSGNH